jgi:hypothetical protein
VIGRLRGRNLPIATAVFAETLSRKLEAVRSERATPAPRFAAKPAPGARAAR